MGRAEPCREPSRGLGAMRLAQGAAVPRPIMQGGGTGPDRGASPLLGTRSLCTPLPQAASQHCITLRCSGVTLEGRIPEALLRLLHLFMWDFFPKQELSPMRGRAGGAHSPHRAQTLPQGLPQVLAAPCGRGQSRGVPAGCQEGKGRIPAVPVPAPGVFPGLTEAKIPDFPPQNRWLPAQLGRPWRGWGSANPPRMVETRRRGINSMRPGKQSGVFQGCPGAVKPHVFVQRERSSSF